eukprot:jgi/Undpi1/13218/HiC_scaffold_8.g02880.m1
MRRNGTGNACSPNTNTNTNANTIDTTSKARDDASPGAGNSQSAQVSPMSVTQWKNPLEACLTDMSTEDMHSAAAAGNAGLVAWYVRSGREVDVRDGRRAVAEELLRRGAKVAAAAAATVSVIPPGHISSTDGVGAEGNASVGRGNVSDVAGNGVGVKVRVGRCGGVGVGRAGSRGGGGKGAVDVPPTALFIAAREGFSSLVNLLLRKGGMATVNFPGPNGKLADRISPKLTPASALLAGKLDGGSGGGSGGEERGGGGKNHGASQSSSLVPGNGRLTPAPFSPRYRGGVGGDGDGGSGSVMFSPGSQVGRTATPTPANAAAFPGAAVEYPLAPSATVARDTTAHGDWHGSHVERGGSNDDGSKVDGRRQRLARGGESGGGRSNAQGGRAGGPVAVAAEGSTTSRTRNPNGEWEQLCVQESESARLTPPPPHLSSVVEDARRQQRKESRFTERKLSSSVGLGSNGGISSSRPAGPVGSKMAPLLPYFDETTGNAGNGLGAANDPGLAASAGSLKDRAAGRVGETTAAPRCDQWLGAPMPESSKAPAPMASQSTAFARLQETNGGSGGGGGNERGLAQEVKDGRGGGGAGVGRAAGVGAEFEEKWDVALSSLVELRTLFRAQGHVAGGGGSAWVEWEGQRRALEETISELNMRLAGKDHDIAQLHVQLEERERDLGIMHGQDLGPLSPLELLDLEACLQASLNRVATGRQSAVSRYKSRQQAEGTMHPGNNGSRGAQPALP